MGLASIGPVQISHGNPTFSWDSTPIGPGLRGCRIGGSASWVAVKQLSELIANPGREISVGGRMGVLEYLTFDDDLLGTFTGWYLIDGLGLAADHKDSLALYDLPFTLSAVYCDRRLAATLTRSARARPNGFDLAATAIVSDPHGTDSGTSDPFVVSPGGIAGTRPFDARSYSRNGSPVLRRLGFRAGLVSTMGTELGPIAVPTARSPESYGADCRAWDRSEEVEVIGPGHPFAKVTDLLITNGLVRCWPGPVGTPAYLHCSAFYPDDWTDVGCLSLAEDDVLIDARLDSVAPDEVTIVMLVRNQGEVSVTLYRDQRIIGVRHGGDHAPVVSVPRTVGWAGMPPTRQLTDAVNDVGRYGRGLRVDGVIGGGGLPLFPALGLFPAIDLYPGVTL